MSDIVEFNVTNRQLTHLSNIPINATLLSCEQNQLVHLPQLPINLEELYCQENRLVDLPPLPNKLEYLHCNSNELTQLPDLPPVLRLLDCANNKIVQLPDLPDTIEELYCYRNDLSSMPRLSSHLLHLNCKKNKIAELTEIPCPELYSLECNDNRLTSLPRLPKKLGYLNCSGNALTELPSLPKNLHALICNNNQLTAIRTLPSLLTRLNCKNNNITELPVLPNTLMSLECDFDKLSEEGFHNVLFSIGFRQFVQNIVMDKKTICNIQAEIRRRQWQRPIPPIFNSRLNCRPEDMEDDDDEFDEDLFDDEDEEDMDEEQEEEIVNETDIHKIQREPLRQSEKEINIDRNELGQNIFEGGEESVLTFLQKDKQHVALVFHNKFYLYDRSFLRLIPENLKYKCNKVYERLHVSPDMIEDEDKLYFILRKVALFGIALASQIKEVVESDHQCFLVVDTGKTAVSTVGYEVYRGRLTDLRGTSHCQEGQDDKIYALETCSISEIQKKKKGNTKRRKKKTRFTHKKNKVYHFSQPSKKKNSIL